MAWFEELWSREKPSLSAKALLATQKRIPGIGNGVLQDILSVKSYKYPCRICGSTLVRETYLGGNIYYCPVCQKEE